MQLRAFLIFSTDKVMNTSNGDQTLPRWTVEVATSGERALTAAERVVVVEVLAALRRVRHGTIQLAVQDGKVVQIETTEKKRL